MKKRPSQLLLPSQLKTFEKRYDHIVKQGFDVNPREPPKIGNNKGTHQTNSAVQFVEQVEEFQVTSVGFYV